MRFGGREAAPPPNSSSCLWFGAAHWILSCFTRETLRLYTRGSKTICATRDGGLVVTSGARLRRPPDAAVPSQLVRVLQVQGTLYCVEASGIARVARYNSCGFPTRLLVVCGWQLLLVGGRAALMNDCRECQTLESEYHRATEAIRAVTRERFNTVREKLLALYEAQEVRDSHLRVLYDHQRNHPRKHHGKFHVHKRKSGSVKLRIYARCSGFVTKSQI